MRDRWDEAIAAQFAGPVGECVYGSRLIGSDPALVLHGGGNTSVKTPWRDITGVTIDAIYVKGSGWDLATIEPQGLTPLPLSRLRELLELAELSDPEMMSQLSMARLDPAAPQPSVETLLHAFLPHRAVLHSHADVVLSITNLDQGASLVGEVFGDRVVVVPYVMPGFDLARAASAIWAASSHERTIGMVLLNHGLFSLGDTTRQAYQRHVELITLAEKYLETKAPLPDFAAAAPLRAPPVVELAALRRSISEAAGRPMILSRSDDEAARWLVSRPDLALIAGRGPVTPDHVIRTKRLPLVGRDVAGYTAAYRAFFEEHSATARTPPVMRDPAPRVVLDPEWGMLTAGATATEAAINAEVYRHTIAVIARADALGGFRALDARQLFDVEYWDLELAKLARASPLGEFTGEVALVSGAASGIGRACTAELLARGAAVIGLDVAPGTPHAFAGASWIGIEVDVTDDEAVAAGLQDAVERFGGIDMAVMAAGIFGGSRPISQMDLDEWRRVMAVNLDAVAGLMSRLHPFLALASRSGRVVVIASKNVPAPGPGAAAYSASKAALTQLARVAALEWAGDGIRVNCVHPDAVFDTGLWNDELLQQRASSHGVSVDQYRRRNLLGAEVTSAAVARMVAAMCGDVFALTTGAQVPVDGGNERVI